MVNAGLNATSAVALLTGYVAVRRRKLHRHRKAMMVALAASALFLVFYVTRVAFTGTHEFAGEGWARVLYLAVLFSHMLLAIVVAPLVVRLVWLVGRRRFRAHGRLARWTFPLWAYVSVTGLLVYLLLYQLFGYR